MRYPKLAKVKPIINLESFNCWKCPLCVLKELEEQKEAAVHFSTPVLPRSNLTEPESTGPSPLIGDSFSTTKELTHRIENLAKNFIQRVVTVEQHQQTTQSDEITLESLTYHEKQIILREFSV